MKQHWKWLMGGREAPAWVHGVIAILWAVTAFAFYARWGWCVGVVFCAWAFGVRGEMFFQKERG